MTSSGTYDWEMTNADIIVEAFDRIQVRPTAITREHLISAKRSLNLELRTWTNRGVNLWEVKPFTLQIVEGQTTYTAGNGVTNISPNTVSMLDIYYSVINGGGAGVNLDRIMLPISRTQYAEIPNKLQPGNPTVYWYNKEISPTLTIWQPPIQAYPQSQVSGYYLSLIQDAYPVNGQTPDVVNRGIDALCSGMAARLAQKFNPAAYQIAKAAAKEAWIEFADADREDSPIHIIPQLQSYWNN